MIPDYLPSDSFLRVAASADTTSFATALMNLFWWVGVPAAWIVLLSYPIARATL